MHIYFDDILISVASWLLLTLLGERGCPCHQLQEVSAGIQVPWFESGLSQSCFGLNILKLLVSSSFIFFRNGMRLMILSVHSEYDLEVQQHRPRWPDDCWWVSWRNDRDYWYMGCHGSWDIMGSSHRIKTCRLKYKEQFLRNCRKQDYRLEVIWRIWISFGGCLAHQIYSILLQLFRIQASNSGMCPVRLI